MTLNRLNTQEYLNNFFSKYIKNELFIIFSHNAKKIYYSIDIRLFCLKYEFISTYSYTMLRTYIMEILVMLLKDDYNLDLINVGFYETVDEFDLSDVVNLGKFAERQRIKNS